MKKLAGARANAALAISIIALVVATAGSAIAASHYLISSSSQIKPRAITAGNIARGTLTATNVARHTLSSANIRPGGISASSLSADAVSALHGQITVRSTAASVPPFQDVDIKASCQPDEHAIAGGFGDDGPTVLGSRPDADAGTPTAWIVSAENASLQAANQTAYVVCLG
jgi:hypothetical protein